MEEMKITRITYLISKTLIRQKKALHLNQHANQFAQILKDCNNFIIRQTRADNRLLKEKNPTITICRSINPVKFYSVLTAEISTQTVIIPLICIHKILMPRIYSYREKNPIHTCTYSNLLISLKYQDKNHCFFNKLPKF